MKSFIALLSLVLFVGVAQAETINTRLLLHGQKTVGESQFGVAGWVIAPNITSSPSTWLIIIGSCFVGKGWNIELMAGEVVDQGTGKFLLDTRLEFTPDYFHLPLYTWHNFQWIKTGGSGTGYWYSQLDWKLPLGLGLIGVETENTFNSAGNDWSVAPQAVIPLSDNLVLVIAPQAHFGSQGYTGTQVWFRTVINL